MSRYIDVKQGDQEWLDARMGIPTASEFNALVSPSWKVRTGEGPETYLVKKLAERWFGRPLMSWYGGMLEQGSIMESEARPWYEFTYGVRVRPCGFFTTDDGAVGASPDGVFDDGTGIEIKCPAWHTHIKWLLDGGLPKQHAAQVQGSMYVTGTERWQFLSYCRGLPALIVTVERDEQAMAALAEALLAFNERLKAGYERLVQANGGQPPGHSTPETAEARKGRE